MKVLLIAGGWSSEREVSLRGAKGIHEALVTLGHEVTFFDLANSGANVAPAMDQDTGFDALLDAASAHDFAFINLHGAPGEDGLVQAMLEAVACPYQGSGPTASFLALHKAATKQILRRAGMLTPDWVFLPKKVEALEVLQESLAQRGVNFPLFVKSNDGGSSLLLSRVDHEAELQDALAMIFDAGCEALVEPCIEGVEITCGVLGGFPSDEALPPVMIVPKGGTFFDYHHKYTEGAAQEICPAPISAELTARIQALALQAHKALGLHGYSRADFIVREPAEPVGQVGQAEEAEIFLLEVNTLPGMTPTSLIPQEATAIGLDFPALIARLMELSLEKHKVVPRG